jgi:hypothetical protein
LQTSIALKGYAFYKMFCSFLIATDGEFEDIFYKSLYDLCNAFTLFEAELLIHGSFRIVAVDTDIIIRRHQW